MARGDTRTFVSVGLKALWIHNHNDCKNTFVPSILVWGKVRSSLRDTLAGGQMKQKENLRRYIRSASNIYAVQQDTQCVSMSEFIHHVC